MLRRPTREVEIEDEARQTERRDRRSEFIAMYPIYARVCACARFGAEGHTFNFARPITKSDMHHSEINSQQQRAHVLFVMSRSNSPERVGRARRRSARKMSPAMVAGSSYLPSELPVNDNPWCTGSALPIPCISAVSPSRLIASSSDRVLYFRLRRFREISYAQPTRECNSRISIHIYSIPAI